MLWKCQILLGMLVVLAGVLIAVFPQILVALVAVGTMIAGAALIVSAWRLRRLRHRCSGFLFVETFKW